MPVHIAQRIARRAARWLLPTLLLLVVVPAATAQPRDKCLRERADAENFYLEGAFDEAIRLLQACLVREELFVDEAVQVYRLMGLAALNKGEVEQAQQTIRDLLQIVPAYEGDPIQDPPSYTTLVAVVRQEVAAEAAAEDQQAPPEEQQAPIAQPPVSPEAATEDADVIALDTPTQPSQPRRSMSTPKTWLLATGGALVVFSAVALALGGGSNSSPSAQR